VKQTQRRVAAAESSQSAPVMPVKARIPQSMPEALNSRLRRNDKGSAAPTRSADATLPGPSVRRQRSVAARRTAGLNRSEHEARIVSLLNRGVAIAEIARARGSFAEAHAQSHSGDPRPAYGAAPGRVLTLEEIESLWKWFESDALSLEAADILKLELLTGARCGKISGLRAEEIDRQKWVWTLPAEPGRLAYFKRPSFFGEILCCWRPRWIPGTKKSPMHAYACYVWRKEPRSGPSLKVRVGRRETIAALSHEHADPTPSVREVADFP
jgi:integrase